MQATPKKRGGKKERKKRKKKKKKRLSVQPGLRGSNAVRVGRKMPTLQFFFPVQGKGGSPTGPGPENRLGDQEIGNPGRPVISAFCREVDEI